MTNAPKKKKLIEVSLPLEAINAALKAEKSRKVGKPQQVHHWWARRPITAARAVLFAQLVDDPSSHPDRFPSIESQDMERARLHRLIEKLVLWDSAYDVGVLQEAKNEILRSTDGRLPTVIDPFAGGGSIPVEAQRLGLPAIASDLNPVAVLINLALIDLPARFADRAPVHPSAVGKQMSWLGAQGLAADLREYGNIVRAELSDRLRHLYPDVVDETGTRRRVISWVWARTVRSPNPSNPIRTPLVRTWWLSKKKGKEAYIVPEVVDGEVHYTVRNDSHGPRGDAEWTIKHPRGAKSVGDGTPFSYDYIRAEGRAGRMGDQLIAVVAEGPKGRIYLPPSAEQERVARIPRPSVPGLDQPMSTNARWFSPPQYGLDTFGDLFTPRQLTALSTLTELIPAARDRALHDAVAAGWPSGVPLHQGGNGAEAYADAIAVGLAMVVSRLTDWLNSLCSWENVGQVSQHLFGQQSVSMAWDYSEANVLAESGGSFAAALSHVARAWELARTGGPIGTAQQADASSLEYHDLVVSTDPPYYDNIGYADLSDFFYIWLRHCLEPTLPDLFATLLVPKVDELIANPDRHGGSDGAKSFFIAGFNRVFERMRQGANPDVPLTVYYAYKQQESNSDGRTSSGWHTLLSGLIKTGWEVTATWPMRTEMATRLIGANSNALASSIVLTCRPRPDDAAATTRRAFVGELKAELPDALRALIQGTIAPVDLAQAAIGPGISVFSRYSRVREADGSDMSVENALLLVNATLDEVIGEQESDFDPDTRFAVKWYRQYGWSEENSGVADQLARSSDTSVGALERGGIFEARGGKARLLSPVQLEDAWDVTADERVSVWEATVRLAAIMAKHGADQVAALLPSVQTRVNLDAVKELGFLLFHEAEKKRDTKDAILFNGLVSAWGDVNEQARKQASSPRAVQQAFDFDEDGD